MKKNQKMFDKNLFDMKKLQRLKNLKKTIKMKKNVSLMKFFNDLIDFNVFNFNTLF